MVRLERETSNSLISTLEEWNTYLQQENIEVSDLVSEGEKPRLKGPTP